VLTVNCLDIRVHYTHPLFVITFRPDEGKTDVVVNCFHLVIREFVLTESGMGPAGSWVKADYERTSRNPHKPAAGGGAEGQVRHKDIAAEPVAAAAMAVENRLPDMQIIRRGRHPSAEHQLPPEKPQASHIQNP
jgi:hypothetical protein